jgi:DNA invertase Pin-like site-specific DNA recombinase
MTTATRAAGPSTDRLNAGYDRVSLDEQKTGRGVASQHEENAEFAEELGHPLTVRYSDSGFSAYSGIERPDYKRLLRDIAANLIAIVVVWHADRLTRDTAEGLAFIDLCRKHKVRLFSVQRGSEYNFNRAKGRADFLRDIVAAQEESAHKAERVSLARKRQARNGEFGGGMRRYGWGIETGRYRSVCINPKADIADRVYEDRPILDMSKHRPEEAEEIRHWAKELLSGVSMAQLLRDLAAREVPTQAQTDRRLVKLTGKVGESKWNSRTVKSILTSPRVAGHSEYRGEIVKRDAYPPIITEEQRQALITLFAEPSRKKSPGNTPKWLGSLIYECSICDDGSTLSVRANHKGEPVYRCRSCSRGRQIAAAVDKHVESAVIARLSRPDVADLIPATPEIDFKALREEAKELERRKDEAGVSYALGRISLAVLETATAQIEQKLEEIRAQLATAARTSPLAPFVGTDDAESVWASLSLGRRREVLRTLARVVVRPKKHSRGRPRKDAAPYMLDTDAVVITVKGAAPEASQEQAA